MSFAEKILFEGLLLEQKIIGFDNPNWGNFVVMIGSPGAGKTLVAKNLLGLKNFKHLSPDIWTELLAK